MLDKIKLWGATIVQFMSKYEDYVVLGLVAVFFFIIGAWVF